MKRVETESNQSTSVNVDNKKLNGIYWEYKRINKPMKLCHILILILIEIYIKFV